MNSSNKIENTAVFWEKAWQDCRQMTAAEPDNTRQTVDHWEKRAANFARNTLGEKNSLRQRQVIRFLEESGVPLPGMKVLDIGCGPGNYAIPLAAQAEHLWALDPSPTMLAALSERMVVRGINNISLLKKTWEEIDLDQENWRKKFDLVFAAMTPGINNGATLRKMIDASRGYCLLSKFAGPRRNHLQEKLWQLVRREEFAGGCSDFIYPFNLLYTWGYFPTVKFITAEYINENSLPEAVALLVSWLQQYQEVTPAVMAMIESLAKREAVDGIVRENVSSRTGIMVWQC